MFKLSITGADNLVSIPALKNMVEQFPHLELALLYFPEKEGQERNPDVHWRNEFFSHIPKYNTAIHLCGTQVFETILSENFEQSAVFQELKKTQRIQININARKNIFSHEQIHKIYSILLKHDFNLILQYHERSQEWILPYIEKSYLNNIEILLDASLGKGVTPEEFIIPDQLGILNYPVGFAGGLNPDNIALVHAQVKLFKLLKYWLDLESGVRTDNLFDMEKAQKLCESVFKLD